MGSLELQHSTAKVSDKCRKNCIEICTSGQIFFVVAATAEERQQWISAIQTSGAGLQISEDALGPSNEQYIEPSEGIVHSGGLVSLNMFAQF